MAIKRSVLEIDVNDARFKDYLTSYNKYRASVDKLPGAWGAVTKENKASVQAVQMMTAALLANMDIARKNAANQNQVANDAGRVANYWRQTARYTKESAEYLYRKIQMMARWTGIGTALTGLVTGVGLWGLERFASSANVGLRSVQGQGLNYGQQKAFGLAYERLIDSMGFLGNISTARGNLASSQAVSLYALGMDPTNSSGNTADVANEALKRIRNLARQTPESELGLLMQSHGLGDLGIGIEDLRRLRKSSDEDFADFQKQYAKRSGQLEVSEANLKKWQELDIQLDASANMLKTVFLNSLTGLTGPIKDLSEAAAGAVKDLSESGLFRTVIDSIAKGLKWFADYIKSEDFRADIKLFVDSISMLAQKTVAALRWLNLIPDPEQEKKNKQIDEKSKNSSVYGAPDYTVAMGGDQTVKSVWQRLRSFWSGAKSESMGSGPSSSAAQDMVTPFAPSAVKSVKDFFKGLANPPQAYTSTTAEAMDAYARAIAGTESDFLIKQGKDPYKALGPLVKGDQAHGKYQVMGANIGPWTKEAFGKSMTKEEFLADPQAQEALFRFKFKQYMQKYGNFGDAASMWHSGMPLADAAASGAADVNMKTTEYVRRTAASLPPITIQQKLIVEDRTGGKVNVTAATMGMGSGIPSP